MFAPAGTDLWLLFAQSVALAAAIGAGFNLLPFSTGGAASDGLGIVTSFMANPAAFASRFSRPFATEAERALYLEQTPRARHWVERGLKHYPTDPQLLSLAAVVQAAEGEADNALAALEALGHPDDHPSNVRNELLANAAWAVLLGQQRHLFTEAVRACERLLQADPSHVRGRLLHGWLLEERGAPDAAYAELMAGYRYSRDAEEEDQFVARLAMLAKALDKPALAVRFGAAAEKAALGPTLQRRLQQTLNQ